MSIVNQARIEIPIDTQIYIITSEGERLKAVVKELSFAMDGCAHCILGHYNCSNIACGERDREDKLFVYFKEVNE